LYHYSGYWQKYWEKHWFDMFQQLHDFVFISNNFDIPFSIFATSILILSMACAISKRTTSAIFFFWGATFISAALLYNLNFLSVAIFISLVYLSMSAVFVIIETSSRKEKRTTPLRKFVNVALLTAPVSFFLFGQAHDIIQSEIVSRSYFNGMLSVALTLFSMLIMVVIIGISLITTEIKTRI
jgi:hypothetical protein